MEEGAEEGGYGYKRAIGGILAMMEVSCTSTVSMSISWL